MHQTVLPALADPLFQLQIAPDAAFPHPAWQQARAAVLEALDNGSIAVLLGPPGSGKSLLLKELARTLRQAGKSARLIERTEALDGPPGNGILLVDEADTLSPDALATLCAGPAPVVLAALPGFPARLAGNPRPVREAVLDRLQPQDVARYVAARLNAVGRPRNLVEPEAVLALAGHSGGLLRLVNTLGGAAVFLAGLDGSEYVSRRHVDEAASMRDDFGDDGFDQDLVPPFQAEPAHVALPPARPVPTALRPVALRPVAPLPDAALPVAPLPVSPVVAEPVSTAVEAPAPAPLAPPPNFRAERIRRRAALGTMATASAVLFALPWLTRRQPAAPSSSQTAGGPVSPADSGTPPLIVADSGAAGPAAPEAPTAQAPAAQAPTARAEAPPLEAPPPPAAAPLLPHPEPVRRADKAPSAPPAELRVTMAPDAPVLFQGPIYNETIRQSGHVALVIRKQAPGGAITARFDASQGLLGSGVLAGSMSGTGRITASGQLMVGKNPFNCDLNGTIVGDKLTGSASFVRNGGSGLAARSVFTLTRA